MENENKNIKKNIWGFIAFCVSFVVMWFVSQNFFFGSAGFDVDKELTKVANEINKTCPITVDHDVVLNNTMALPNKTLQYNYTLVNFEKAEVNLDTVKKYVFPRILENVKTSPEMKELRDHKVTFNYNYTDKNGVFVVKKVISPDMYLSE